MPTSATQALKGRELSQLQFGSHNSDVTRLKKALRAVGYGPGEWDSLVNGPSKFDRTTETVVIQFQQVQKRSNSKFGVDGVVGPQTWGALQAGAAPNTHKPPVKGKSYDQKRLMLFLNNRDLLTEGRDDGRRAVGNTSANACAATASQALIYFGVIDRVEVNAQALANKVEKWRGPNGERFIRITDLSQVQDGDLIVCEDWNFKQGGMRGADHIWWSKSRAVKRGSKFYALCYDNRTVAGSWPYERNLNGSGPYTAAAYALRLKAA